MPDKEMVGFGIIALIAFLAFLAYLAWKESKIESMTLSRESIKKLSSMV